MNNQLSARSEAILLTISILIPSAIHYHFLATYAHNILFLDDFPSILDFLNKFKEADFSGKQRFFRGKFNKMNLDNSGFNVRISKKDVPVVI